MAIRRDNLIAIVERITTDRKIPLTAIFAALPQLARDNKLTTLSSPYDGGPPPMLDGRQAPATYGGSFCSQTALRDAAHAIARNPLFLYQTQWGTRLTIVRKELKSLLKELFPAHWQRRGGRPVHSVAMVRPHDDVLEKWFQARVASWGERPLPTEDEDLAAAKHEVGNVSRDQLRLARQKHAPPGWLKRGRRNTRP